MKALVLMARGLHLGYIGCYGNEWVQTPALDRLAAEGIVFDQHYADQPDAAGAERAWQTGCYHFPSPKPEESMLCREPVNLFALLAERDIATFLIHDEMSQILPAASAGWQSSYRLELAERASLWPGQILDALNQALVPLAGCRQWLLRVDLSLMLRAGEVPGIFPQINSGTSREEDDNPLAATDDSLSEELLEAEDLAYCHLQDGYAARVKFLDTLLACIVDAVEQRGLLDEMLVLVTSDRGQQLGENTFRLESRLLHEELIHIPLVLRLPGKAQAGRRISWLTQSIDLLPTLYDLFGQSVPTAHGYSLLPLAKGQTDPIRPYACAGLWTGASMEWALRSPDWALLLSVSRFSSESVSPSELYVKPEDRWEVNNVRQHHLEFAERLEQTLRLFVQATRQPGSFHYPELPAAEPEDHPADSAERSIPI